jgi:hypothetical protein
MKKLGWLKRNITVIRAVVALGVSVVIAFLACGVCFGWFSLDKHVSGNLDDMYVTTGTEVSDVDITYYKADSDTSSDGYGKNYIESTDTTLGEYNMLSGNDSCRLLIKIVFDGTYNKLTISAVTTTSTYLGKYKDGSTSELETYLTDEGNPLSSVVQFYALSFNEVTQSQTTTNGTTKNICTIESLEEKDASSFVTFKDGATTATYTQKLDLYTISLENITSATERAQANTVFILIEYNELALVDIFGKNLGSKYVTKESIKFDKMDFRFEVG